MAHEEVMALSWPEYSNLQPCCPAHIGFAGKVLEVWGTGGVTCTAHGKDSFHWRSLWTTVFHERDTTLEQGKSMRSPLPEEKGGENLWWTFHNPKCPFPVPLHCWQERDRQCGNKTKPRKKGGGKMGEWFSDFIAHYYTLIWKVINSANFPKSSLFCPWQWLEIALSLSLSRPMDFLLHFLSPVQLKRE